MLYYIHVKRFFIWFLITFLFGVIVSLSFLFSRDLTMNTVKINEFRIYYSFLNKESILIENEIKSHFDILLSPKNYPLLPIAVISQNNCIENVSEYYDKKFDLSICKNFNYDMLINQDKLNIHNYYQSEIIEYNGKSFIYKKFDGTNEWLIASIKDYYKLNDFNRFVKYITDDKEGLSWLSSAKSFKTFLGKSKFIWMIIIPFSCLLYIIFTLYYLKQTRKLRKLNKEKNDYIEEWNRLNKESKELISEQIIFEEELRENQNKRSIEEIQNLEIQNNLLLDDINKYIQKLKNIEEKEDILSHKLNEASKKLTDNEKEQILVDSLKKLNQLDLLWKYKPSWQERHKIENIVSLRDEFTPFTISQAFICFEKIIENLVIKEDIEYINMPLIAQINIIFERNILPIQFMDNLHSIRRARNRWFHAGKQPDKQTYDILLDILDKTNTQPLL